VPIVEEELLVTKRLVVREEARIHKKPVTTQQQISDQVKRQDL